MLGKLLCIGGILVAMLALGGCGDDEKNLSDFDKTPAGIDANGDGIRDEIAERMHKEFAESINADEMHIMEEHAKVFQEIMTVDMEDRTAVLMARDHLDVIMNCAVYVFGDDLDYDTYTVLLTRLRQWYFNTKARREIRKEFVLRSREYHYQSDNFNGANTCDFELSLATKRLIEIRHEISARKNAKNNNVSNSKDDASAKVQTPEVTGEASVEPAKESSVKNEDKTVADDVSATTNTENNTSVLKAQEELKLQDK